MVICIDIVVDLNACLNFNSNSVPQTMVVVGPLIQRYEKPREQLVWISVPITCALQDMIQDFLSFFSLLEFDEPVALPLLEGGC